MYKQKYLKYKKKYIDLKNQLSFVQGSNYLQKYKQFGGNLFVPRSMVNYWTKVASSADGTKLIAISDCIYTSIDSGITWTPRNVKKNITGMWNSVASSADGSKLVAVEYGGHIYTSIDSGETWSQQPGGKQLWKSVASSADGTKLVAVEYNGNIYTRSFINPITTTPNKPPNLIEIKLS